MVLTIYEFDTYGALQQPEQERTLTTCASFFNSNVMQPKNYSALCFTRTSKPFLTLMSYVYMPVT